jgi:hypothetical protein
VDCYFLFNLIELIETKTNVYLEKKLKEYEGEFEQDELIMDMSFVIYKFAIRFLNVVIQVVKTTLNI